MASPTTSTAQTAIKVRYYPIVVESRDSYDKTDTSDEFYLVIHNEATDVLLDIIIKSVAGDIAEMLKSQIPELTTATTTANDIEDKIVTWLDGKFSGGLAQNQQLKAKFVEKINQDKAKMKGNAYTGHMQNLDNNPEKPKRDELLVYDPEIILDSIVDSQGNKRTLGDMIKNLVDDRDLFNFLMEVGHMAG